jgi:hypothetical protein
MLVRFDHIAKPHRRDRERFIVRADEKLTASVELEHQVLTVRFIWSRSRDRTRVKNEF